ncbi:MAG: hypothetical protein WCW66_01870 [Patescibacteria group bacterium]
MISYIGKSKKLIALIVFLEVILALLVFYYPVIKPIPVGTDAITYINDAQWITSNQIVPKAYQATYNGFYAYPSPLTDINIVLINQFTGLDFTYPLFSIYQLFLIVLIVLTSYLVGKTFNSMTAVLFPIAVLGSFAIIRLFAGSTVSNLLAFTYVNIIYYLIYSYSRTKKNKLLLLIIFFIITLYFTHKYLTAPVLLITIALYIIYLFLINKQLKHILHSKLKKLGRYKGGIIILFVFSLIGYALYAYYPVIKEGIVSFWGSTNGDKFRGPILVSQYGEYLGPFLFTFGVTGIVFYIIQIRKNLLSYRIFPLFWILMLLIILQTYRLGIDFYYERIVFLAGVFIAFFAVYPLNYLLTKVRNNSKLFIFIMTMFVILIISSTSRVKELYDNSNIVTNNQIRALNLLKTVSKNDDLIFSHVNGVSQTNHDVMISERSIQHITTELKLCGENNDACLAFNQPDLKSSIYFFKNNNIKYFLLMKPNQEGNKNIDNLAEMFSNKIYYNSLFNSNDALLFELI